MSRLRKTGLTIDDPLAPVAAREAGTRTAAPAQGRRSESGPRRAGIDIEIAGAPAANAAAVGAEAVSPLASSAGAAAASATADDRSRRSTRPRAARMEMSSQPVAGAWRSWSGGTRVASYRLPDELLAELASTSAELQLQVGLVVTAAIAYLLDESDDVIASLVDRADDARIRGRRAARRRVIGPLESASAPQDTL